jgi:pyridine nucleotide-disulfide oxidoreductase family protein
VTRLVLVGGGHAHLHVLADLAARPLSGVEATLVSPSAWHHYSGMVPGFLQGVYAEGELAIDLASLAARARARLVEAPAERIAIPDRTVDAGGASLPFDVLSLDVGADPAGLDAPGAGEHAVTVRPMRQAVALRARIDALAGPARRGPVRVTVVGAGAGGVEVALALHRRIRNAGSRPELTLVEAASDVLPDYAPPVRRRAARILAARGVAVTIGRAVSRVEASAVQLDDGARVPADLVVWLAGAAGPALLRSAGLALDPRGFLLVGSTLRVVGGAPVWGAGDCATLAAHPETPKAGVYAVRQGPVLARNLRAALGEGSPAPYVPQRTFLSLLNTADGKALLRWHGVVSHSRVAWWLKDRIDRRFVRRYRAPRLA